jgi:ABC-type lipoprotein release transport system permease subunit
MAHQLYDVRAYDPFTLVTALLALGMSATIAGFVPARRAASIEPMVALRSE